MRRSLHYVFKVGNRDASYKFYTEILGMKVLRHEEFEEGCKATCNGPYDGKWSKTMVGYGAENENFVLELTYNYGIGSYKLGTDFESISISSSGIFRRIQTSGMEFKTENSCLAVTDPDGHKFLVDEKSENPKLVKVSVNVSNLNASTKYWSEICGLKIEDSNEKFSLLSPAEVQTGVEICVENR